MSVAVAVRVILVILSRRVAGLLPSNVNVNNSRKVSTLEIFYLPSVDA